jgi:glycosyltransferase involved in cell wall biosynthesis
MKKIAFHTDQLGLRGVEVSTYDYAYYNEEILQNKSFIISDKNRDLGAYKKFSDRFEVFLYDNFSEVNKFIEKNNIDIVYYQKAGHNDGKLVPNAKNLVHTVFQYNQPHGDVYAYISKWLSNHMSGGSLPYVPYIVDILKYDHDQDYRDFFSIPKDAMVFGYYGGSDSFNIDFAKRAVIDIAKKRSDIYFLFMNSDAFGEPLPNVLFLEGTTDFDKKIGFINTCDACIHARNGGESFGLTVAEFSSKNKPIITTGYCTVALNDLAHLDMLGDRAIIYNDYEDLCNIFNNFNDIKRTRSDWNCYNIYNPKDVMDKFKQIFLNS